MGHTRHAAVDFRSALESAFGLMNWQPVADGEIHRFHISGDRLNSKNGWYILFPGEHTGFFGSWKLGIKHHWSAGATTSQLENILITNAINKLRKQREIDLRIKQESVADYANQLWSKSNSADSRHPYLVAKGCRNYGLRQKGNILIIPIYDKGELVNLQYISPNGEKRFLNGGKLKGCYALIGSPLNISDLYICEGWATGATIHEETEATVACTMSAANILSACQLLQIQYPHANLIIAGDDDRQTDGNPGRIAATRAATALGCGIVMPQWPDSAPLSLTDFNDLRLWLRAN